MKRLRARSRVEVIVELLDAVARHPTYCKSRVFAFVGVNGCKGDGFVRGAFDCGFVDSPVFRVGGLNVTEKGRSWMRQMMLLLDEAQCRD